MSSAWAGQEDFLEEAVCDTASKNRAAEGRRSEKCRASLGERQAEGTGRQAVFRHR